MIATSPAPSPTDFSTAPLRNRIRVELSASPREVWALVGDLERFPEYSAGLERVEATRDAVGRCTEYVCHFRAPGPDAPGIVHREVIRWYEADRGYASVATEPNDFGLQHALTLVTLEPAGRGTILTWSQYFDGADVPAVSAAFDEALADIGARLVARFGGRTLERVVEGRDASAAPAGGDVAPDPSSLSTAPLRNRMSAELDASPADVWALVGDFRKMPEYSAGLQRVEVESAPGNAPAAYTCHFRPMQEGAPGPVARDLVRWYAPSRGWASVDSELNDFGTRNSLHMVTLAPDSSGRRTLLNWQAYYDAADMEMNKRELDGALADIAARLVERFGGRVTERYTQP